MKISFKCVNLWLIFFGSKFMCCQNSLKKIYIFSLAFIFGIFTVAIYQSFNSSIKFQKRSADVNLIAVDEQTQTFEGNKNEPSGFSEQRENELDKRNRCLNYCRVCKCEADSLNERPKISETETTNPANSKPLNVIYKPKPQYTEEAKNNNIQGNVRVRVTFLADGEIGSVSEVAGLPFGLTERAIEAAKKIRFEPQKMNGKNVAVSKVVVFNFTIY